MAYHGKKFVCGIKGCRSWRKSRALLTVHRRDDHHLAPKAQPAKDPNPQPDSIVPDLEKISEEVKNMTPQQLYEAMKRIKDHRDVVLKDAEEAKQFWHAYRVLAFKLEQVLGHDVRSITFNEDDGGDVTIKFNEY